MAKMSILETEIKSALKMTPNSGESEQKFLTRVGQKVNKLRNKDYDSLSDELQAWGVAAIEALNDDKNIPSLTNFKAPEKEEAEEPKAKKGAKKSSKAAAEDDETEPEEEEPEDGDVEGTEEDGDEPVAEDDQPEEEENEEVDTKKKAGKATAKKAAKPEPKKAAKSNGAKTAKATAGRGRPGISLDAVIKIKTKDKANPRRKGTEAFKQFAIYKDGLTVGEFLKKGGARTTLNWDIKHGDISIGAK